MILQTKTIQVGYQLINRLNLLRIRETQEEVIEADRVIMKEQGGEIGKHIGHKMLIRTISQGEIGNMETVRSPACPIDGSSRSC